MASVICSSGGERGLLRGRDRICRASVIIHFFRDVQLASVELFRLPDSAARVQLAQRPRLVL